jgi:hypothetical protein
VGSSYGKGVGRWARGDGVGYGAWGGAKRRRSSDISTAFEMSDLIYLAGVPLSMHLDEGNE